MENAVTALADEGEESAKAAGFQSGQRPPSHRAHGGSRAPSCTAPRLSSFLRERFSSTPLGSVCERHQQKRTWERARRSLLRCLLGSAARGVDASAQKRVHSEPCRARPEAVPCRAVRAARTQPGSSSRPLAQLNALLCSPNITSKENSTELCDQQNSPPLPSAPPQQPPVTSPSTQKSKTLTG